VELGHTDTDYTTCLHVPSIGLVVAGDAAYNDVHLYLAESNTQTRREWVDALDKIEALNPRAVVASHKRPENEDDPRSSNRPGNTSAISNDSRNDEDRAGALRQDVGAVSEAGESRVGALEFGPRRERHKP